LPRNNGSYIRDALASDLHLSALDALDAVRRRVRQRSSTGSDLEPHLLLNATTSAMIAQDGASSSTAARETECAVRCLGIEAASALFG